ncbi:amylo-alpha-1,6-glucosidase [Paenibacillus hodogayensis]|uniref:Amylo-alpha-1,6-glucosidase n=1 Tax=Paenibacillus hodogayensis TaxID=279208 RepID=A0ABV5VZ53_9BACL
MKQNAVWPNRLGEGGLFAFSGMDGETNTLPGFTSTWGADPYSLLFHTKKRRVLHLNLPPVTETVVVTGDVCKLVTASGECDLVYASWHTLTGSVPVGTEPTLVWEDGVAAEPQSDGVSTTLDEDNGDYIALAVSGSRFGLSYGKTAEEAADRATAGAKADAGREIERRLLLYGELAQLPDDGHSRLLNKCVSVMKVNTLSPEGAFRYMWSTPDRVPHKDMWLWDTVFHSLAMNEVNADISWQCLRTMLETARPDGMIVHQISVSGKLSVITQPPILAWGVWENYVAEPDLAKLSFALPILERYLEWDLANRDANGNGLPEWAIEGNVNCRSGESGMDNSPRFDEAIELDAVDFSVFVAQDMKYVARIAAELGKRDKAAEWNARASGMAGKLIAELWDEEDGFFYDKRMDGRLTKVKAVSGFLPLLLEELPTGYADRLLALLRDPAHFGTACPVPSLAVSEPTWGTDMWRGPTWINLNYMIVQGLKRHGRTDEAAKLADATIAMVNRYYERYGVIFEYYDAKDELPPTECDRKGPPRKPYNIRNKVDAIRDYHWSAALTACLLLDKYGLRKSQRSACGTPTA